MARTQRWGQGGRQSGSHFVGADEGSGQAIEQPRGVQRKQEESKEKLIGFSTTAGLGEQRTVGECELGTRASKGGPKKDGMLELALDWFACMEKQAT